MAVGCTAPQVMGGQDAGATVTGPPAGTCVTPDFSGAPLGVKCNALVDEAGRTVLLHGMNAHFVGLRDITLDDGTLTAPKVPVYDPSDPVLMRAMGYNALRLTVNWSALEPTEDGGFDESKFDQMADIVKDCRDHAIRVLIDIHQDGYSKYLGEDGAPKWAIIPPPPAVHYDGSMGNQNVTAPVLAAFKTFFGPTADGIRLRQRYAAMLVHVGQRFADEDAVFGFEIMNEPIGTQVELDAFHTEMIAALRPVVPGKLILFEPSATRNQLDSAPLGGGSLGDGTVYAPHVYTGVFNQASTPITDSPSTQEFLRASNQSARDEATSYLAPLLITEWGYGPTDPQFPAFAELEQELQDEYLTGSLFWLWKDYAAPGSWGLVEVDPVTDVSTVRASSVAAFSRLRLEAVAGYLSSVSYDPQQKIFEARYIGSDGITADNLVSIGATPGFASYRVTCDGRALTVAAAEPLSIPCAGAGEHVLTVAAQ